MAVADNSEPRTYGNWRRPGGGGLFGLGKGATYGGLLWAAAAVFVMIFTGPLVGFGLLVLGLGVIALASVPVFTTGRTVVELVTPRVAHLVAEVTGRSRYRSGPLSGGKFRLPGLATASTLTEAVDAQGRPFAIVTIPKRQHHTIVFTADPDGAALVDQADVDVWVARWGQWLAALGDEPGLVAVSVTVETAPDRGERLRREISATTRPDAPTVAALDAPRDRGDVPVGKRERAGPDRGHVPRRARPLPRRHAPETWPGAPRISPAACTAPAPAPRGR